MTDYTEFEKTTEVNVPCVSKVVQEKYTYTDSLKILWLAWMDNANVEVQAY